MRGNVLLQAAGALRPAYEAVTWAATPLGPVASWSVALRNALDLALNTQFPVTLFWGPQFVLLYNEAYRPLIAEKHPSALGSPAREVFPEAWATIGPMMEGVLAGKGATWVEDAYVPLERHGRLDEAYFTFSYSPVRSADGVIEGVMDIATETTLRVIDRRRLQMLNAVREMLDGLDHVEDVDALALPLLRANDHDLPGVEIRDADPADGDTVVIEEVQGARWARLPVETGRVLVVRLSDRLTPDTQYIGFLRLVASSIGQALARIRMRESERGIAEAIQRSLLTTPPATPGADVAVRYRPATARARVGGDWYDAFVGPGGALTVAVGDVTGHDRQAAAAMAQIRSLLRGVSYTIDTSPAHVLSALDRAMEGLGVGVYATTVLAHLTPDRRTLRWSNAGHPPPVLIDPDGRARLLESPAEVLLGLNSGDRANHTVALEPGATVAFYTDGLIEQRSVPIQERLDWLTSVLAGGNGSSPEELCDQVLARLEEPVDDDVALLVLRVG